MLPCPPPHPPRWVIAIAWLSLGPACAVPALDFASKSCPCAAGWTCDEGLDTCVKGELYSSAAEAGQPSKLDGGAIESDAAGTGPASGDSGILTALDAARRPHDASAHDGEQPDAQVPVGPSPCAQSAGRVLVYDGFEADHVGFTEGASGTHFDRGSTMAHGGETALRIQVAYPTIEIRAAQTFSEPITDGEAYLQAFLFLDESVNPVSIPTLALINATSGQGMRLIYTDGGLTLQVGGLQTTLALAPVQSTIGRWMQVEILTKVGQSGELTVCIDGRQVAHESGNTTVDGGYSRVELGVLRIPNTQGRVILYADDFLLQHAAEVAP